jgi:hypothetical protein
VGVLSYGKVYWLDWIVLKKGYIWRIGDGTQINIWEDSWIPSSHNLKIMTPKGTNILQNVSDLINPIDGH